MLWSVASQCLEDKLCAIIISGGICIRLLFKRLAEILPFSDKKEYKNSTRPLFKSDPSLIPSGQHKGVYKPIRPMYVSNHSLMCRHLHLYQNPQWEWPTEIGGHHSKEQQLCACENNLKRLGQ